MYIGEGEKKKILFFYQNLDIEVYHINPSSFLLIPSQTTNFRLFQIQRVQFSSL